MIIISNDKTITGDGFGEDDKINKYRPFTEGFEYGLKHAKKEDDAISRTKKIWNKNDHSKNGNGRVCYICDELESRLDLENRLGLGNLFDNRGRHHHAVIVIIGRQTKAIAPGFQSIDGPFYDHSIGAKRIDGIDKCGDEDKATSIHAYFI